MVENIDQYFLKSKMTSLNVVFCAQLKDIQFTLTDSKDSQRESEGKNWYITSENN